LFEHFNHPNTDIVIDGVATQLKATDSISYINGIDDNIPVIATSEVAQQTDAIDSEISNMDMTETTELALGGTVIDIGDTSIDTILGGLGGLGLFSSIKGINHAAKQHVNGKNTEEAIVEGIEIAVTGTAKGIVNVSELAYKGVTSRPCRLIGRNMLKIVIKIF